MTSREHIANIRSVHVKKKMINVLKEKKEQNVCMDGSINTNFNFPINYLDTYLKQLATQIPGYQMGTK